MSDAFIDEPTDVREGEGLPREPLAVYLAQALPSADAALEVRQFPSGFSNLTYFLSWGKRELVLRRPPFGANVKSGHDMSREFRVLSALIAVYPHVPRPLLFCDDISVIGAPFYVMERVEGVILRGQAPAGLDLTPDLMGRISRAVVDNLARLHAIDYEAAGLGDLGHPPGYVERQVDGWIRRYERAQTDDIPDMSALAGWMAANRPVESGAALIHNDYKYDNIVLDPDDLGQVRAVLDWEMATLGDPLMDLGTSLAYWSEPDDPPLLSMFGLTHLPGNLDRRGVVERYQAQSGRDVTAPLFYFVYGLYKLAVIGQQIYFRYDKGFTQDARFAALIHLVRACGRLATTAIERDRIYDLA